MNKFKYYFILLILTVSISSCSKKDDTTPVVPPRDYNVQYATDIADIEEYLKTNYITVVNHPGFADDQDVTIAKIDAGQASIMSYLNAATYPKLLVREVSKNKLIHDVPYKIYYLVLRPGIGQSPSNVDGVLASYRGDYLQRTAATTTPSVLTTTKFDESKFPQFFFSLYTPEAVPLRGWSEIFPQFKTGTYSSNADGSVSYNDFGAGVMFIPSGLAYYNTGAGAIPAYAPLIFSFKLYEIERLDQDLDGIPSYLEDNGDGYIYDYRNTINYPSVATNPDDTDGDGIPDFLDIDDDGDGFTTKSEIKNPATGVAFPFAAIPTCTLGGKKNYLDKTCHP